MKRIALSLVVLLAMLLQNCKKSSSDTSTTTTNYVLTANINGTVWEPDTLSANITYNVATKTKVLNFTGTYLQKRLTCAVSVSSATNTNDFPLGIYNVDATGNPVMTYSSLQKDSNGNLVFIPVVTAGAGDGYINITSVSGGLISGTFAFTTRKANYDSNGNITSVTNNVISSGTIASMPYTFISN